MTKERAGWPRRACATMVIAVLAASVVAQSTDGDAARQKVLGRVVQLDGTPWAGATVRLVAWPYPYHWFVGAPDELTVTSDARGRFEARLLSSRHYSAWAFAGVEGGGYRLTKVVDDVVAASLVELHERPERQGPIRLRIVEPAGAPPFGPLSFRVVTRAPTQPFVHELALDADGDVLLPPIPASYAFVEALTGRGVRVWNAYLPTASGRRAADAARAPSERSPVPAVHEMSGPDNEVSTIRLPAPTPVAFTVKDARGPVADAEILIGAQTSAGSISDVHDCRVITRTDASGKVALQMYLSWNEAGELAGSSPDVVVRSDRHYERMFRMLNDLGGQRVQPTRETPEAHVTLDGPSYTAAGTLLLAPGEPARGVPVLLYDAYSTGNGASQSSSTRPIVTTTDAAGAFAFPGRKPGRQYRLTALLQTDEPTGREEVYLANSEAAKTPGEHGTLIASELVHIDFQITTQDGSPADRARIYLAEERSRPATPVTYLTDRSGRCSARVPREQLLNVIVASDDGFAAARLPHPGEAARVAQPLELKIGATLTGVAVDTDGAPLADVRVSISGGDKVRDWYAALLDDISSTTYALDYRGTYTDADGRFRAVFPEAGVPVSVSAWRNGADGRYMQMVGDSLTIELAATGNEPLRLVLDDWKSR